MDQSIQSYDVKEIRSTVFNWLESRLDESPLAWLTQKGDLLKGKPEDRQLYISFSAVTRYTGKKVIEFTEEELNQAGTLRQGWIPSGWTADQLGRIFLILSYADQKKEEFLDKIEKIFISSDWGEAEALYRGLPLYPYPEEFAERTAEGVRSNITPVFNAIALNNPYPKDYLDEVAWNQIVLKALFVGSPVYKILGVDERANKTLAKILVEYAHERWSAGRPVSPELWRPVGPFLSEEFEDEIEVVFSSPEHIQKQAAALALISSNYPGKKKLAEKYASLVEEVKNSDLTWDDIGREYEQNQG
ncbi:MAG: EboA domain-containing protein [Balneolaceae bacterium]|nr:EboA domain-containing protein [Balneolaceae bacterium]